MPKFRLEDIEDYYTYYVQILHISEDVFWNASLGFINKIIENKTAYDGWMNSVLEAERVRLRGQK